MIVKLSKLVRNRPFDSWLVGGYIRDSILGIRSIDFDIATTGNVHRLTVLLAKKLGGVSFPLDKKWGEFRIALPGNVTIDIKSIRNITEDIQKRDFTINAIAFSLKDLHTIYDPLGGLNDIKRKLVRPVKESIFIDDPLRLLRMFRIARTHSLRISKVALDLAQKYVGKIEKVASERIRSELFLLMDSEKSYLSIKKMDRIGLIGAIFPDIEKGKMIPQRKYRSNNLKEHSLVSYDIMEKIITEKRYRVFKGFIQVFEDFTKTHRVLLKLAALLHDIGKLWTMQKGRDGSVHFYTHEKKGEVRLKQYYRWRLALSNKEVEILSLLILHHMRAHLLSKEDKITNHALYRFVKVGGDIIPGILLLSYADSIASNGRGKEVRKAERTIRTIMNYYVASKKVRAKDRLITGNDLIEIFGLTPGPMFKLILDKIEKAQIEKGIRSKKDALELVKKLLERKNVK